SSSSKPPPKLPVFFVWALPLVVAFLEPGGRPRRLPVGLPPPLLPLPPVALPAVGSIDSNPLISSGSLFPPTLPACSLLALDSPPLSLASSFGSSIKLPTVILPMRYPPKFLHAVLR